MLNELIERAREFLTGRKFAYQRIFLNHGTDTDLVLQDLAKFCRAHGSTFPDDAVKSGILNGEVLHAISDRLDGRREVWNRIMHHLHLTDEEIWNIYANRSIQKED